MTLIIDAWAFWILVATFTTTGLASIVSSGFDIRRAKQEIAETKRKIEELKEKRRQLQLTKGHMYGTAEGPLKKGDMVFMSANSDLRAVNPKDDV